MQAPWPGTARSAIGSTRRSEAGRLSEGVPPSPAARAPHAAAARAAPAGLAGCRGRRTRFHRRSPHRAPAFESRPPDTTASPPDHLPLEGRRRIDRATGHRHRTTCSEMRSTCHRGHGPSSGCRPSRRSSQCAATRDSMVPAGIVSRSRRCWERIDRARRVRFESDEECRSPVRGTAPSGP